jgi:hypothetical protein
MRQNKCSGPGIEYSTKEGNSALFATCGLSPTYCNSSSKVLGAPTSVLTGQPEWLHSSPIIVELRFPSSSHPLIARTSFGESVPALTVQQASSFQSTPTASRSVLLGDAPSFTCCTFLDRLRALPIFVSVSLLVVEGSPYRTTTAVAAHLIAAYRPLPCSFQPYYRSESPRSILANYPSPVHCPPSSIPHRNREGLEGGSNLVPIALSLAFQSLGTFVSQRRPNADLRGVTQEKEDQGGFGG